MIKQLALVVLALIAALQTASAATYIVVFKGTESGETFQVGGSNLLNLNAALGAVTAAGGIVTSDMTQEMGVAIVSSPNALFADVMRANPLVEEIAKDFSFRAFNAAATEPLPVSPLPEPGQDALEFQQWEMKMIDAPQTRSGDPGVLVAVLDTGMDVTHQDFFLDGRSNIDVARARSFAAGADPTDPNPLIPSDTHGTLVAGLIGARRNGIGIVGVAPNVTIVPIKVAGSPSEDPTDRGADARFSWVIDAVEYAAEIGADVINMSFAINATDVERRPENEPTWCSSNTGYRAARKALERAIRHARARGALPVAAIGNGGVVGDSNGDDLSADDDCDEIPQETPGVVTVGGLAINGVLSMHSNWGSGVVDLVAPDGGEEPTGPSSSSGTPGSLCAAWGFSVGEQTLLSTFPGSSYTCVGGTSFAAPLVSGVAALIVSQSGHVGPDGDIKMNPNEVEDILLGSAVDIGTPGDDMCYGVGRVDALRAVLGDTNYQSDPNVTGCLRYPTP